MKAIVAVAMGLLFALNAALGTAGGVLLCNHCEGAHMEFAMSHSCGESVTIHEDSKNFSQPDCGHLSDFVLIGEDVSKSPKIASEFYKIPVPILYEIFTVLFESVQLPQSFAADTYFAKPPDSGGHIYKLLSVYLI